MTTTRLAGPGDIDEIIRLREVMLSDFLDMKDQASSWKTTMAELLERRLGEDEPTMGIIVVDAPDGSDRLAACAVGTISERLPGPHNPSGRYGWIFNVVTDPGWRRRGYSRACMDALLAWYREREVHVLELLASESGQGLYEQLGFTVSAEPAMRGSHR
jgi:GNAT superfamily N-acetyltransferase